MSTSLRTTRFLAESPFDRPLIHAFLERHARELPAGSRVLDAGAGDAPYRSLFAHCDYITSDWSQSPHPGARSADVIAPLGSLPLPDGELDLVVSTQVLEHVADPLAVLLDFQRILRPAGELWLTAPFVWEMHEEPHDYFRYTSHALRSLLERSGFATLELEPMGGYFSTMAQLLRHCGSSTGLDQRGLVGRAVTAFTAGAGGRWLARLDRFDQRRALPLNWGCRARRL